MEDRDSKTFRRSLSDVRVISQDRVFPHADHPSPVPKQTIRDEQDVLRDLLSDSYEPEVNETGEELSYRRPGVQRAIFRKLRLGEYTVTSELDLHGHTTTESRQALIRFLCKAQREGHTCVRIIHGKGLGSPDRKPVLKAKVFKWLCQRDEVLAVCSARPFDGGSGAVYVLLKKKR